MPTYKVINKAHRRMSRIPQEAITADGHRVTLYNLGPMVRLEVGDLVDDVTLAELEAFPDRFELVSTGGSLQAATEAAMKAQIEAEAKEAALFQAREEANVQAKAELEAQQEAARQEAMAVAETPAKTPAPRTAQERNVVGGERSETKK